MRLASEIFGGTCFIARRVLPAPAHAWVRGTIEKAVNEQRTRRCLREAIRASGGELKVIIGAGETALDGWVTTNYPLVDIADLNALMRWFQEDSVKAFLAEHVWEHLTPEQAQAAAVNCYGLLVPGGHLRIAVPDGFHPDHEYIDYVKPGGTGPGCEDHHVLYNYRTLTELLEAAGFNVRLLEWFDEERQFHSRQWNPDDGFVCRSTRYDQRNAHNPTAYTSIIADAIKPGHAKTQYADSVIPPCCQPPERMSKPKFYIGRSSIRFACDPMRLVAGCCVVAGVVIITVAVYYAPMRCRDSSSASSSRRSRSSGSRSGGQRRDAGHHSRL